MQLDLLYEIDVPKPWPGAHPTGQRLGEQRAYDEAIAQIKAADQLGFGTVWLVEHHFREGRSHCPAPEVVLGALSQCTENLRLGFGVTLTPFPFTHPARIAEKVATVDVLSHGRVEWGTGRSTPMEQTAFGVPLDRSKEMWREAIEVVCGMWEQERFSYESPNFSFPERVVTPKPFQDPHPPCWMAATSDGSAATAGELGLGLLSFSIMQPLSRMARQIEEYRSASQRAVPLTRVVNDRVAAYTLVHCAESLAQAEQNGIWDAVWWWYQHLAEFIIEWEFPNMPQEEVDKLFPYLSRHARGELDVREFHDADMIVVGDPEQCLEKMQRYADLGVDQLMCYVQFGGLSHESVMRNLELLGTEIIPKLAKRGRMTTVPADTSLWSAG